jgi:1,4-dihydroxy-2-naphthoate polyprenyltransferase
MSSKSKEPRPHLVKVWWIACRPHTLTASLSPIIVAYNASLAHIQPLERGVFVSLTVQWAIFCMMMQLGTNLHNDYADFIKGADTDKRVGQARATQKGWLTPTQTATASCLFLFIGSLLGLGFILNIQHSSIRTMGMIFIVSTSIFNAFAYTGGWPLNYIGIGSFSIGYSGLGDLFVFLYFGLVATLTLPFLYLSYTVSEEDLLSTLWTLSPYAVQVAVLGVNIIVVNNLRDRFTDIHANKFTLAVRFGDKFCRIEYASNLMIAYGLVCYDWVKHAYTFSRLLPFLSLPLAFKELHAIYLKDEGALNPHVGGTAKVQFLFCIMLGIAIRLA